MLAMPGLSHGRGTTDMASMYKKYGTDRQMPDHWFTLSAMDVMWPA